MHTIIVTADLVAQQEAHTRKHLEYLRTHPKDANAIDGKNRKNKLPAGPILPVKKQIYTHVAMGTAAMTVAIAPVVTKKPPVMVKKAPLVTTTVKRDLLEEDIDDDDDFNIGVPTLPVKKALSLAKASADLFQDNDDENLWPP